MISCLLVQDTLWPYLWDECQLQLYETNTCAVLWAKTSLGDRSLAVANPWVRNMLLASTHLADYYNALKPYLLYHDCGISQLSGEKVQLL